MPKSSEQMIQEIYTVMLGVPGTDDRGLVGDCREIKVELKQQNGDIKKNTTWRKAFCWALGLIIPLLDIISGLVLSGAV